MSLRQRNCDGEIAEPQCMLWAVFLSSSPSEVRLLAGSNRPERLVIRSMGTI